MFSLRWVVIGALAALASADLEDAEMDGHDAHGEPEPGDSSGSLDSLPDVGVCIDGIYPLFKTEMLANMASSSNSAHEMVAKGHTLYMPNGMYPNMQMTSGQPCPSVAIDATAIAELPAMALCIGGYWPMYKDSALAIAASPEGTTHSHTWGNWTLYMPNGHVEGKSMTHGTCPADSHEASDIVIGTMTMDDHDDHDHDHDTIGGDDDEQPCFPSSALVTLADGTPARLDALRLGDVILASTLDGTLTTDTVSLLSIAKPEAQATFVTLATDAGQTLTLTPEHHLPVGEACCSNLKTAKQVVEGDTVWTTSGAALVTKKGAAIEKGLHSPVLTRGTFPVVDGVVTSFDAIEVVQVCAMLGPFVFPLLGATGTAALARSLIFGAARNKYITASTVLISATMASTLAK